MIKPRISLLLALLSALAVVPACGVAGPDRGDDGGEDGGPPPPPPPPPPQDAQLVLENNCSEALLFLYVWPCTATSRGDDQLGRGNIVPSGRSFTLTGVPPGCYSFRVESLSYYWEEFGVQFFSGASVERGLNCEGALALDDEHAASRDVADKLEFERQLADDDAVPLDVAYPYLETSAAE